MPQGKQPFMAADNAQAFAGRQVASVAAVSILLRLRRPRLPIVAGAPHPFREVFHRASQRLPVAAKREMRFVLRDSHPRDPG
jgi:hypothetical protein